METCNLCASKQSKILLIKSSGKSLKFVVMFTSLLLVVGSIQSVKSILVIAAICAYVTFTVHSFSRQPQFNVYECTCAVSYKFLTIKRCYNNDDERI